MARLVEYAEVDLASPQYVAVSSTASLLSASRVGKTRRKSIVIVPLTGGVVVTVVKADAIESVSANKGIVLTQNQPFVENDDTNSDCWQGGFYLVSNNAGYCAVTEIFESPGKL